MREFVAGMLLDLNRKFYADYGKAFSATRQHIQPGVQRILDSLAKQPAGKWLDLGCGNGSLVLEWARRGRKGLYCGLDFSTTLLEEARVAAKPSRGLEVRFLQADLSRQDWSTPLAGQDFDGVLAFAVLHHLPGKEIRRRVLLQVNALLRPGGHFIHSEWQFQHSPRLLEHQQPWMTVGLTPADVEAGDTLMDWRYVLLDQPKHVGLRYVHLFNRAELVDLARETGFIIIEEFESDGKEGNLGLYQLWRAIK